MALNFVVTALFAVLFLGSEGESGTSRLPCKVRTEIFNANGSRIDSRDVTYPNTCQDGLECPIEWDHPTQTITLRDESPGPNRTNYILAFCEIPFCGIPLCNDALNSSWTVGLTNYRGTRPILDVFCRCSDGFRSLQYVGEDWFNQTHPHKSQRVYKCETPECSQNARCMVDTLQSSANPGYRRVWKDCNCSRGQRCNDLRVNNDEKKYYCSNP